MLLPIYHNENINNRRVVAILEEMAALDTKIEEPKELGEQFLPSTMVKNSSLIKLKWYCLFK